MLVTGNNSLNTYRLSIRVYPDGFSFFILNGMDGSVIQQDDFKVDDPKTAHEVLADALKRPYLMDYRFAAVELVVASPGVCIPLEYFRREEMVAHYRLNYPEKQVGIAELQYQILPTLEIVMLFYLNPLVLKMVKTVYPDAQVVAQEGRILEDMADIDHKLQDRDTHFYYLCMEEKMLICTFQDSRLQYNAVHNVTNDADRLYYMLSIWKNLGLEAEKNPCFLKGASEELTANIRKYILKVDTCE